LRREHFLEILALFRKPDEEVEWGIFRNSCSTPFSDRESWSNFPNNENGFLSGFLRAAF
jgi:hypothetical protein